MKDLDIRGKAKLLRHLGHPTRLLILEESAPGAKCVTDIRDLLDIPQPNVSQHLAVLRQNRIVDHYEDGQLRCYSLLRPTLVEALLALITGEYPVVRRDREDGRRGGRQRERERTGQQAACDA